MAAHQLGTEPPADRHPLPARVIRKLSPLIILMWTALTLLVTFAVPSLEQVGREHSVPMSPKDAPAVQAMTHMGENFKDSSSDSFAMIILEGEQPLDTDAHEYYEKLVGALKSDTEHVEHVQDLWGDRLTASGAQSADGKAVYAQLNLAGDQGTTLSQNSVAAVRDIVDRTPPPPGIKAYVTGPAALAADMQHSGDRSILKMTFIGAGIIFAVLLLVYRSLLTVVSLLIAVGIEVFAARGIVAYLGDTGVVVLSTFAINMLVALAMAAGTDYGIFFFGRYQEARQAGVDREAAYYTTFRSVAPVVLGSGLTIASAMLCLSFTRMPIFQTIGVPCAVGMLVSLTIALTLGPAILSLGGGFGLYDPRRELTFGRWRRIGTAIVRWPGPILAATLAVSFVGLLALPMYQTSYNDRQYVPKGIPADQGYAAADRHFSQARMMPEILMIEADHDLRNPADFLVLHKLAKAVFKVPGISRVQGITRPEGQPIEHTSIPFLISMQNAGQEQSMQSMRRRVDDMLKIADLLGQQIELTKHMYGLQQQMTDITHQTIGVTKEMVVMMKGLRDNVADFDDFFRPIRNYFYWDKHCDNIPLCSALKSIFEALDGIDILTGQMDDLVKIAEQMDTLLPQLLDKMPPLIASMETMRGMLLTMHSTMSGSFSVIDDSQTSAAAMGRAFDAAHNDDTFYLPPEVFENPDFQRAMSFYLSPDGKSARLVISHKTDPATPEGIARVSAIKTAAEEALKTTPLVSAKIEIAGTASTFKDFRDGSKYDLLIAAVGALCLIFLIMLLITRSMVATLVIVGTVVLSLGSSFGLSVLIWQYILGIKLHWMVLPMSVIVLLAVGSDYNLLLVSRMKEEIAAGINTGIIRAMAGTGKVVTNAGLVFALTMASMVFSDLRIIGQVGTTIGIGLLFDTLVVRSFLLPSIAALLGRWFWWPKAVRPRPASRMLRDTGPRSLVRELFLREDERQAPVPAKGPKSLV
ncbi:RND family transporter [Mycobacterium sp. TNTM28]|uniref:RND family transporter n=1 Tax=[Mycobacterium] fortunisiensis TaxID=2600579 RepID=A0ABS6KHI6_9MYCO|nr:RND family transporter [[Mycobacterium] fortunisiensis]MBU9763044.1 RND family transporter [[Mycobacterium] fortunisiensis]